MNFPEIVDIALPAEGVFHNLDVSVSARPIPCRPQDVHGLWGMGQMMFTKYLVVVDEDVDVHDLSEVIFRLCSNTEPRRDAVFTRAGRCAGSCNRRCGRRKQARF